MLAGVCHHERLAQGDRVGAERATKRQLADAPMRLVQLLQPACALEKEAVRIYQRYQRGRCREELTAELCQAIVAHFGWRVEQCGPPQSLQPIRVAGACHRVGRTIRLGSAPGVAGVRGLMEDGMSAGDWQDVRGTPGDPNALRGKRVLIMGLGLLGGGVAAARHAVEQGAAEVVATDLRDEAVLAPSIAKLAGLPIRYVLGRHDMADFARADVVGRNPGVRRDSAYLAAARAAGARIEMELDWFFRACPGKIAGVTGTRGKTTTTLLLHHILRAAGQDPRPAANLGGIETLALLPHITPERWVVLELGNFMLEGLHTVRRSPHLAIFTNLLPDHLNAYASMEEYGEAKASIFRYQGPDDLALFNADNDFSRAYAARAPAGAVWLYSPSQRVAFPRDDPDAGAPFAFANDIRLRGEHNVGNVQAATLAATLVGVERATIGEAV